MTPGMHPYEGNGRRTPYLSSIGNGTDGCRQALFKIGLHIWTLPRSPDGLRFDSCTFVYLLVSAFSACSRFTRAERR